MNILSLSKARAKELSNWSNKFWLFTTMLGLARDLHDLLNELQIQEETEAAKSKLSPISKYTLNESSGAYTSSPTSTKSSKSKKRIVLKKLRSILLNPKNQPLLLDMTKNIFDIFLPLSNLEFIKVSPGMQGFLGLVSSLLGLLVVFDPKYKLSP